MTIWDIHGENKKRVSTAGEYLTNANAASHAAETPSACTKSRSKVERLRNVWDGSCSATCKDVVY